MGWDNTAWRDIGGGVEITEFVQPGNPPKIGLVERHDCIGGYQRVGLLPYGPAGRTSPHWQVLYDEPLTLVPSVLCTRCGLHGWIRDGVWASA